VKIATGETEAHPTPLPLNPQPAVAPPTAVAPAPNGPTIDGRDTVGEYQAQMAAAVAGIAAAQAAGNSAETGRRLGYEAHIRPLGAFYGDQMTLPPVPCANSKHTGPPPADGGGYAA
jgi:hypothetical protein